MRVSSGLNPFIQLRLKRDEWEHAVLELHLVKRAYIETFAKAGFGVGAHLGPFYSA